MTIQPNRAPSPLNSTTGGALAVVMAVVLVLALVGAGGYWAYHTHYKKEPLRTRLAAATVQSELLRFTHDHVSGALYHNLVMLDDIVVLMNAELNRLQRIANRFPNQEAIVFSQTQTLQSARDRLSAVLTDTAAELETIYVVWLLDRSKGASRIHAQRVDINRRLADAIRGEAVLISRIRTNAGLS